MNVVAGIEEWLPDERSAALITSAVSLRYLSGAELSGAVALVSKEESFLLAEANELEAAKKAEGFTVMELLGVKQLLDLLVKYGVKRVFIESTQMTVSQFNYFKEQLHYAEIAASSELSRKLMSLRMIKNETELKAVKKAQGVCDKAYQRLLGTIRRGMTERQIAAYLTYFLAEFGADEPAFPARVYSDKKTGTASGKKLEDGSFLVLEFGAKVGGYCASMARTIAAGEITPKQEDAYNAVSCAVFDGVKALREGIGSKVADSVARSTLNAWGMDKYAVGDFGHGTGLEAEEPPYLGQDGSAMLKSGMTLTVGCELVGRFGIKIADCVAVTADGCVNFTAATRNLVHI